MSAVTSLVFRIWSYIRGHTVIRLVGAPRPGNYLFVTSPDLPGFSFMLAPGEHEDIATVMRAIDEPLKAFIDAEYEAGRKQHTKMMRFTGARQTDGKTYLAELCVA